MGAYDGYRRREPVAPAVGDRPSIGDGSAPGKARCPRLVPAHPAEAPEGHSFPLITSLHMQS